MLFCNYSYDIIYCWDISYISFCKIVSQFQADFTNICFFTCLIGVFRPTRNSYGEVTIIDEGLQILTFTRHCLTYKLQQNGAYSWVPITKVEKNKVENVVKFNLCKSVFFWTIWYHFMSWDVNNPWMLWDVTNYVGHSKKAYIAQSWWYLTGFHDIEIIELSS